MANKPRLKEVFELKDQFGAFYTGGKVSWSSEAKLIYCQNGNQINAVDVESVTVVHSFAGENVAADLEDPTYTFALSPDDAQLVTAHKSGLFKLWDASSAKLVKMWKSIHQGPISQLVYSDDGKLLASGGADSMVRVWDIERQVCKGTMRGCQGVVSVLKFHPTEGYLLAAGDDSKIHCWDYETRQLLKSFESHFSTVTGIVFTADGDRMVSCGRDKVLILWDFIKGTAVRTIPVYEALEAVILLPSDTALVATDKKKTQLLIACAGEEGSIKVWDVNSSKLVFKQSDSMVSPAVEKGGLAVTHLLLNSQTGQIAVVSVDHNIIIHDAKLHCEKQLVGFSDEILDLAIFNKNRYLAMATNSNDVKLYDVTSMNCIVLRGHTDIVLAVAARGQILVSSAKDYSVRVWRVDANKLEAFCLGTGTRHTAAVGSVDLSDFLVSASQDKCIKLWRLPELDSSEHTTLTCLATALAHEKDINSIVISPNNKLVATGSQDKTAKLWDASDLSLIGVLRGHRRGIWTCRFSPADQILMTTAADCTMRLWSLTHLTCLKSFEGHESSVLRAEFLSDGMQIISTGADGLLKLWNIKTSECMQTLDKHESRVWALAVASDEQTVFSGGGDSLLVRWTDATTKRKDEQIKKSQELALQDQQLANLISQKKLLKALKLALKLDRPHTTLKIINDLIKTQDKGINETILSLNDAAKEGLLRHATNWNTNSRNCVPAQLVVNILLDDILSKKLIIPGLGKMLEETIPYTERHYRRMQEFSKDIKFIEYTLRNMQPYMDTVATQEIKMEEDSE